MTGQRLTERELVVLQQAARGLGVKQSARETHHAVSTIKFHRTKVLRKLGATTMPHAVTIAYRNGLLELTA